MDAPKLDQKDREILDALFENSRQTVGKLGSRLGMPPTTVHHRIKRLESAKIIRRYSVEIDHAKMGRAVLAYVGITINYNVEGTRIKQLRVAEQIKKLSGVQEVTILAGGMDIIAKVRARDIDELNQIVTEKLRNIDGVDKTQTMIALKQV